MCKEPQTLIVVYQDELILNELKKLVETNDDTKEKIIGTEDGSVTIVAWNEKMWLEQKKTGDISSKVLFIGNIKGTENLIPIVNWKFKKFGVKYGWSGKQAILIVDPSAVKKKKDYEDFLNELKQAISVEEYKNNKKKVGFNLNTVNKSLNIFSWSILVPAIGGIVCGGTLAKDVLDDAKMVKRQQYLYGIDNFYLNYLDKFMKS